MTDLPHPRFCAAGALAACLLAVAISTIIAFDTAPVTGDSWIMRRMQEPSGLRPFASIISNIGEYRWIPFVIAIALASGRYFTFRDAGNGPILVAIVALAVIIVWPFNHEMKDLLDSPRPQEFPGFYVDHLRTDPGFPSGHVYGDVLFFGVLAVFAPTYLPKRLVAPAQAVLVLVIVLSGPSRMIVGAHWPSDVLGGYLWGTTALCLTILFATLIEPRVTARPSATAPATAIEHWPDREGGLSSESAQSLATASIGHPDQEPDREAGLVGERPSSPAPASSCHPHP